MMTLSSILVPLWFVLCFKSVSSCVSPISIENEISTAQVESTLANLGLPYLYFAMAGPAIAEIPKYETPIQFRLSVYVVINDYNVVAMYENSALDAFGRGDRRLCVSEFASEAEKNAHAQVAVAYAFAAVCAYFFPLAKDSVIAILENTLKLPYSNYEQESITNTGTPWGLAKAFVEELIAYSKTDGWNFDGSLTNKFNKMPYKDFKFTDARGKTYTPYQPTPNRNNRPNRVGNSGRCLSSGKTWNWEALLETDNLGYFTRQQHVTPFIGFTGRLYGLTEFEYTNFSSPVPNYDYCYEADEALRKTNIMATDDKLKMQVQLFDNMFSSVFNLLIQWSIRSGMSLFEFLAIDMATAVAIYDATMLVWRDKVIFDLIRPPTVVQLLKGDRLTQSYAGPYEGSQPISGNDWQPYIRVMPHAEYPSGSACACSTFAKAVQHYTGTDIIGVPVSLTVNAGGSHLEPGAVPASDVTLEFTTWSEVNTVCGTSREFGGMHFSKSVPAGNALCSGVGELVVDRVKKLLNGDATGALANISDTSITVKSKTYPGY